MINNYEEKFMIAALNEAKKAAKKGEVPVGAVVVCNGLIVSRAHNNRESGKNALLHAECEAIRKACKKLGGWRLHKCDIYVTLEPCPMCAGAIINSRIANLYFGATDKKAGCCGSITDIFELPFNHRPNIEGGFLSNECSTLLNDFFKALRNKQKS